MTDHPLADAARIREMLIQRASDGCEGPLDDACFRTKLPLHLWCDPCRCQEAAKALARSEQARQEAEQRADRWQVTAGAEADIAVEQEARADRLNIALKDAQAEGKLASDFIRQILEAVGERGEDRSSEQYPAGARVKLKELANIVIGMIEEGKQTLQEAEQRYTLAQNAIATLNANLASMTDDRDYEERRANTLRDERNKCTEAARLNGMADVAALRAERERLREALIACREYLDDRADVLDGEDGPRPDAAMSLLTTVDAALASTPPSQEPT